MQAVAAIAGAPHDAAEDLRHGWTRKLGDGADEGWVNEEASNLATLGSVHSRLDDAAAAITHLTAGLELAQEAGNVAYTVRPLIEFAGRVGEAREQALQALDLLGNGRSTDHLAEAH